MRLTEVGEDVKPQDVQEYIKNYCENLFSHSFKIDQQVLDLIFDPPRPETAVPSTSLGALQKLGWLAQPKVDGNYVVVICPKTGTKPLIVSRHGKWVNAGYIAAGYNAYCYVQDIWNHGLLQEGRCFHAEIGIFLGELFRCEKVKGDLRIAFFDLVALWDFAGHDVTSITYDHTLADRKEPTGQLTKLRFQERLEFLRMIIRRDRNPVLSLVRADGFFDMVSKPDREAFGYEENGSAAISSTVAIPVPIEGVVLKRDAPHGKFFSGQVKCRIANEKRNVVF